jgi:hypothetical protein
LSVCKSVRVFRFKLFSPLADFDETLKESHFIAGHFSRVRFSFLQSATRRGGMRTSETKETLTFYILLTVHPEAILDLQPT